MHRTALNMNIEQFVLFVILICKKLLSMVNLISFCFAFGCFLQVFCCYVSQCHRVTLPNQLVYFVVFFQHYLEVQEHANKALKLKVCVCTCVFVNSFLNGISCTVSACLPTCRCMHANTVSVLHFACLNLLFV